MNFNLTEGKRKIIRIVAAVLLAVMLLLIALSAFGVTSFSSMKSDFKSKLSSAGPGEGFPYQVNSSDVSKIDVLSDDVFILKKDKTIVLDGAAKEIKSIDHTYATPAMSIKGNKALVYDRGGNRYRIETTSDTLYTGTTKSDEKIITAAVGDKGNIALATLSNEATSRLTVINSTFKDAEFIWNCADYTITSAALSDNGKYAAVSVLGAKNGEEYSKVFVFDFEFSDPVSETEYPGTTMVSVNFADNDTVVAVGNNKMAYLKGLKKNNEIDFGTSTLAALSFAPTGETIVALAEYGSMNNQVLRGYSKGGRQSFEKEYTTSIKSIYATDAKISVLTAEQVDVYSLGGTSFKPREAGSNAISTFMIGNKTYVYEMGSIFKADRK
ncbi:MAG: DUF5711 family protein [Clostridia bacterium]|nr:DUF5711 family protein [Clostridia bacterium]